MILNKGIYLQNSIVSDFCDFFCLVLKGEELINHKTTIKDKKIPTGYDVSLDIQILEDGFINYFWDRCRYEDNSRKLIQITDHFNHARISSTDKSRLYFEAIDQCLLWGLGHGNAYKKNLEWAERNFEHLPEIIEDGVRIINSDNPNINKFNNEIRMNAGYTKIFALICKNSIIYDGRVGAALGLLAKKFVKKYSPKIELMPQEICFPWGASKGKDRNRNPSDNFLKFPGLGNKSIFHAKWNIQSNWIVEEALKRTQGVAWVSHPDALRRIEAALFMLGYDLN
jgi:hypothetical protein